MVLQRALNGLVHCDDRFSFSQYLDEPTWPSFTVFQEFLCSNIDCLSFRNPLFVNITHGTKEAHNHTFLFWLGHTCFLAFNLVTLVESIWMIHKSQTEFGRRIGLNPCMYPHLLCYKFSGIIHCRFLFGH